MRPVLKALAAAAVLPVLACGVPEQKYKAALADTEKAMKEGDSQKQRADACEAKLEKEAQHSAELAVRLAALEKAATAAIADAEMQRDLAGQLTKARETLEAEKAAAAADAEQQRRIAAKLEEERARATVEAERQRLLAADLAKKSAEYEALAASLDKEIKAGQIQVSELKGKLTVRMAEKILFPTGSATVSAAGKKTLAAVGDALKGVAGRLIRVEGHTDNVPIHSAKFPSNWELSSARAIAVVRILQDRGVNPTLLGAAGYAEWQPIAPNDTPEGRAQNRRIEISLAAPLSERGAAQP